MHSFCILTPHCRRPSCPICSTIQPGWTMVLPAVDIAPCWGRAASRSENHCPDDQWIYHQLKCNTSHITLRHR